MRNGYYQEPKAKPQDNMKEGSKKNVLTQIREKLASTMTLNAVLGIIPLAAFDGLYFAIPDKG